MTPKFCFAWLAALAFGAWPSAADAPSGSYRIDPSQSEVAIEVGKSGPASFFAGHKHEVDGPIDSGLVQFDAANPSRSTVRLVIRSAALKVSGKGEPPDDVPKVQERMDGDDVLAVERFRELRFESTSVTVDTGQPPAMGLTIDGRLTIRDVTQPVTVPVRAAFEDGTLTVKGRFSVKQSAFGIKPVSVGGVVAVKDALDIRFSIVARR